jgi:hypothetical protein
LLFGVGLHDFSCGCAGEFRLRPGWPPHGQLSAVLLLAGFTSLSLPAGN